MTMGGPQKIFRLEEIAQLMRSAERGLTQQLAVALGDSTVEQWRTLVLLADGTGYPMSEIAEHTTLTAPTLTRLIDRMVSDNLVYRIVDPTDRRRVLVHITPRGEQLRRELALRVEPIAVETLGNVDDDKIDRLIALIALLVPSADWCGAAPVESLARAETASL